MNLKIRKAAKTSLSTKGWSQLELAQRAGIKQATVSRLLAGERRGEPATWEKLLAALGLELVAVPVDVGEHDLDRRG